MLLKTEHIQKSYQETAGRLIVLRDINLEIDEGEMIAITGESGCGKSTLLHVLGLLDEQDDGTLLYRGKEMKQNDRKVAQFRNKEIGFVFQFHYLLEDFSAKENAMIPALIGGKSRKEAESMALELLRLLEIDERKDHFPNQLSGGELQRVAIARALINKPSIVFADEPTGNLDPRHSEEVVNLIVRLNREIGQTFVIVTHNLNIAGQMQKHYLLNDGILQLYGSK